jgi:hypothetical protein
MKKVFYFSIGLLILLLIFLVAYNFAFKNNVNDPAAAPKTEVFTQENDTVADAAPTAASIVNPINESLLGAAVSPDGAI